MVQSFINGVSAYGRAITFARRHNLWGYFLAPALISILLGILVFGSAWGLSDNLANWAIQLYPWDWGKGVVERIVQVFGGLVIVALGLVLFKNLVIALASPFMSPLSEKVELILTGNSAAVKTSPSKFIRDLIRGVRISIRLAIRELFFTVLLLFFGLFPLIGILSSVFIFLVQSYYAGFGNIDFALERRYSVRESIQFIRGNRWLAVGNGFVYVLLLLTGIGFLFALPLGVIAGTMEAVKRV